MPARERASGLSRVSVLPSKTTSPASGVTRPMMDLSVVVLPTPLRPMRHTRLFWGTVRLTPRRNRRPSEETEMLERESIVHFSPSCCPRGNLRCRASRSAPRGFPRAQEEGETLTMLSLSNISVSSDGSRILRGVNLTVPQNSLVCLMGRNGVGKTTTLKSIVGLVKPDAGSVKLGSAELVGLQPDERARLGIGYVPQGRDIFPHLTVW